jgi:hypothetical protein
MGIAQWQKKLSKFGKLDGADKWMLIRAAGWLAIARIMMATTPFGRLAARMSTDPGIDDSDADPEVLQQFGRAVSLAASQVPWRSDCFPQCIAASMLLKRDGYRSTIHIGVERVGDDVLNGHAWLTCGEIVVTGGGELDRYTELHTS